MWWGSRMMLATQSAYSAFRRTYDDPSNATLSSTDGTNARRYDFARLWTYYNSSAFEDVYQWQIYKSRYGLYRATRMIYSPVRRLVDFYAGAIYPGVLSEDGSTLPDGVPLAIPLAKDTPDELKDAIAQFWQWSGWQANKSVFVRYGAALGSVLVEIEDDTERGRVTASIVWPGLLTHLDLDAAGNVLAYTLEYRARDADGGYTYRKEVDRESFRTYRDNCPYDFSADGRGAEWPNPYGFVPAVWARHSHVGSDYGAPAIDGSLGKVDELNSLASHVHDQVHKKINAPALLAGVTSLVTLTSEQKRQSTGGPEFGAYGRVLEDREDLLLIGGPAGASVESLAGTLELDDAVPYIEKLLGEIEQDHPELMLYKELRAMSQVTGPGAARMLGDAAARVYEAASNYDQQSVKLFQMAVAIAGWRAQSGEWGALNRQQQKFVPFNLESYERGDLDFAIEPRPLVTPTQQERWQESLAMWQGAQAASAAGVELEVWARHEGWTDEEIQQLGQQQLEAIKRKQALAVSDQMDGREGIQQ